MTADELKALPIGKRLFWVYGTGTSAVRIPTKVVEHSSKQVALLVYFPEGQRRIRWSLTTNQPVHESRGYVGTVSLET
ncbi:MAG: hypothetical protein JWN66_3723 [Sphingomonas bacterium]|nr:hypothetical protein [Sphingomonas bacterium]